MRPRALCGCTLLCAAAMAVFATPSATLAQPATAPSGLVPAGQAAGPAAYRPKPKWSELCILSWSDGRIVLRSSLSLDMLKTLDGSDCEVIGMPGATSAKIEGRGYYKLVNVQEIGDETDTLTVSSARYGLTFDLSRTDSKGDKLKISLNQSRADYRRSGRDGPVTLEFQVRPMLNISSVDGGDVADLRQQHPHEANRYLRPLLRRMGNDLFQVEPQAARQVLFPLDDDSSDLPPTPTPQTQPADQPTTQPTGPATHAATTQVAAAAATQPVIPPKVIAQVMSLVAELDAPTFARREAAADRLARMGPPAVAVLNTLDREKLTAQQEQTMDLLIASANPLPPEKAKKLRTDVHFLIDCLYAPHGEIRAAAADRLSSLAKVSATRFSEAMAIDPVKNPDRLGEVVEKLRDELAPKEKR